jgi:hypothetical protein
MTNRKCAWLGTIMASLVAMLAAVEVRAGTPSGPGGILYESFYSAGMQTLKSVRFDENWNIVANSTNVYPSFTNSGTDANGAPYAGAPVNYTYPTRRRVSTARSWSARTTPTRRTCRCSGWSRTPTRP